MGKDPIWEQKSNDKLKSYKSSKVGEIRGTAEEGRRWDLGFLSGRNWRATGKLQLGSSICSYFLFLESFGHNKGKEKEIDGGPQVRCRSEAQACVHPQKAPRC